jgi:hypothetical protein
METQKTQMSKAVLYKKIEAGGIAISDFKIAQSHSNQNRMMLKQSHRSMEHYRAN